MRTRRPTIPPAPAVPAGSRRRRARALVLLALGPVLAAAVTPAAAQIISPGKLSTAHAGIEGMASCTRCHRLRQPGVDPVLCLECHRTLGRRIERGLGLHASVDADCATCHKEHLGRDLVLVRLDTLDFDHDRAGWALRGAHGEVSCRACHAEQRIAPSELRSLLAEGASPVRTFLGLPTECAACHAADDPHGGQFEDRSCGNCHDAASWEEARGFDHGDLRFRLSGAHRTAPCGACHARAAGADGVRRVRYRGVPTACASCHAEDDRHAGQFAGRSCGDCHDESRWEGASAFDHRRTAFPLTGRHADVPCTACHAPRPGAQGSGVLRFRPVRSDGCDACHEDPHGGAMGGPCATCHRTDGWALVNRAAVERRFDHRSSGFALVGRHAEIACASCHDPGVSAGLPGILVRYRTESGPYPAPESAACVACHQDAHGGDLAGSAWGVDCGGCHGPYGWHPVTWGPERHGETGFELRGAHRTVACAACHRTAGEVLDFRTGAACRDCHDDPHGAQFHGRRCDECHTEESFSLREFDHGRTTFPLEGAHLNAECQACHPVEPDADGVPRARYTVRGVRCIDCHGGAP